MHIYIFSCFKKDPLPHRLNMFEPKWDRSAECAECELIFRKIFTKPNRHLIVHSGKESNGLLIWRKSWVDREFGKRVELAINLEKWPDYPQFGDEVNFHKNRAFLVVIPKPPLPPPKPPLPQVSDPDLCHLVPGRGNVIERTIRYQ